MADTQKPDVSVVIPLYNNASTIAAQLDSIRRSIPDELTTEIVVVDNRSSDGSQEVVAAWSQGTGVNVRIVPATERQGEPYARNVGIAAARAEHVLFCDGDDEVGENWILAMHRGLEEHSYVTGPVTTHRLNGSSVEDVRGQAIFTGRQLLFDTIPFAHGCNMGFRREALDTVGGFEEDFLAGCDQVIGIRSWQAGIDLGFIEGAEVHYRLRPDAQGTFRQGRTYGRYRVRVRRLVPELVERRSVRNANLRRVGWLLKHFPLLADAKGGRTRWFWVGSQVLGEIQGWLELKRGK